MSNSFHHLYTTPLADILRELSIEFHVYADDQQLYLAFHGIDLESTETAVNKIHKMHGKNKAMDATESADSQR